MQTILKYRIKIALTVMLMMIVCAAPAFAEATFPVIGTDELKALFDKKANFILIDSRICT